MMALFVRISAHFYRPDLTPSQAQALVEDMADDLGNYPLAEVETAVRRYRAEAENRFFPRSGQIIKIIEQARVERRIDGAAPIAFEFGDARPVGWEFHPKRLWARHWRVEDLDSARDPLRRERYNAWLKSVKAGNMKGRDADEY